MTAIRQDAWSADDDLILAEVTLRHIREGSTQLAAFEEVGDRIGRTAAACGFRWNSCVRKNYEEAIRIAKSQRQKWAQQKKHNPIHSLLNELTRPEQAYKPMPQTEEAITFDAVIRYLKDWRNTYQELTRQIKLHQKETRDKDELIHSLRRENDELRRQVNMAETDYRTVNDDYRALIQIMDRARKLAFLTEEDTEPKATFKMDANGNLERVD